MTEIPQFHTHSQTSTQTQTQTQPQTRTQTQTEPESAKLKSSRDSSSFAVLYLYLCTVDIHSTKPVLYACTYLGFKISDRFVLTFTHFSSAAYDGICRFHVDRQTLRRIR